MALAFSMGFLVAIALCFGCLVFATNQQHTETEQETTSFDVMEKPLKPVPAGTYMPVYLQNDAQWSACNYAGGTIGDSGCGLTCAAMAIKYMTTQEVTPLTLANAVGGTCLTDGVNDPEKFAYWIQATYADYGIETTGKLYDLGEALAMVDSGWLCFAGLGVGTLGESEYTNHVVLIWRSDDSGYWVRDPANAANNAHAYTFDELNEANGKYYVCVKGGYYGNARN